MMTFTIIETDGNILPRKWFVERMPTGGTNPSVRRAAVANLELTAVRRQAEYQLRGQKSELDPCGCIAGYSREVPVTTAKPMGSRDVSGVSRELKPVACASHNRE